MDDPLSLRVWALALAFESRLAEVLAPHGLTVAGFRLVGEVMRAPDGLRPSVLAERLGVSRPSVTAMVARLRKDGVVQVAPDPDDARAHRVRIAQDAPLSFGFDLLEALDAELLAGIEVPRAEVAEVLEGLTAALRAQEAR